MDRCRDIKKCVNELPAYTRKIISLVSNFAKSEGVRIYLVGGIVRDMFLGRENLDLDFVLESDAIVFAGKIAAELNARIIRHKSFLTATVILNDGQKIDFATSRKERYVKPAALPVVEPAVLADDLWRRDFSINAMAIDLVFKEVVDPCAGRDDLRKKKIRVLHELSFIDDPTRILRAVRFAKRYKFSIDVKTLDLVKKAKKMRMLEKVHPHRIRDEIILLLKEEDPAACLSQLEHLYGLGFISRKLRFDNKASKLFSRIAALLKSNSPDKWFVYFLAMTDPLSLVELKSLCCKFGLSKDDEEKALFCKNNGYRIFRKLKNKRISPYDVFLTLNSLSSESLFFLEAKYNIDIFRRCIKDFRKYSKMKISLTGDDLKVFGIIPGPKYQLIFRKLQESRINGTACNRADEIKIAKSFCY